MGEPLARRSAAAAGTGRGCLPPRSAALEVTRPGALEPQKRLHDPYPFKWKLFNALRSNSFNDIGGSQAYPFLFREAQISEAGLQGVLQTLHRRRKLFSPSAFELIRELHGLLLDDA